MRGRTLILFLLRLAGFALVTAAGGWLAVPVSAAFWVLLAREERGRELSLALAAGAAWGVLVAWSLHGTSAGRLFALLAGIFRVPGWTLVLLTMAIPALLAWSAAVVAGDVAATLQANAARRRAER